jgi:hypothetical protein
MSFKSAEGSKFIDVDYNFNNVNVNSITYNDDSSVQTTAYLGIHTPVNYKEPTNGATQVSGGTLVLNLNQDLVVGALYAISACIECQADTFGQELTEYSVNLRYGTTTIGRSFNFVPSSIGTGIGAEICIPITAYFIATDVNTTKINAQMTCSVPSGTWNYTDNTRWNLVRLN